MFTTLHFIWLAISIVFIGGMTLLAVKCKFSLKVASLIMVGICLLSEISKMMSDMEPNIDGGMSLSPKSLPFHLCSLMIFVVFYIAFAKDNAFKQRLINFLAVIGVIGSFCALIIPTVGVRFDEIGPYQCFVYHAGLIWYSLYLIISKSANLGLKNYFMNLIILASLAFIMIYVNGALSAYGTNFFYVVRPPMSNLPILNLDHGWYVYFITLLVLGIILITLFHLPFIIKEKKVQRKN